MQIKNMNQETYMEYIQGIFDAQSNILIINDGKRIIATNERFFRLFSEYNSLEEFQKKHLCVCEFFIKEEGYVWQFEDKNWVEYILNNPDKLHKAKIKRGNHIDIFQLNVTKLEKFSQLIISMTDITNIVKIQEEAQNAEAVKTQFLANMSHEIRTPLNAIIGFTSLLNKFTDISQQAKKYISTIDSSASTLLSIVNDILDISKLESDHIALHEESFPFKKEFMQHSELFSARAAEKNIKYIVAIDDALELCVRADMHKLKQIISNLLSNAIKFTPVDGTVRFEGKILKQDREMVQILFTISDSGIGISPEAQENILKPFVQANDTISKNYGGTGLGLSISNKILKNMGSEITIKSIEGIGSQFSFMLNLDIVDKDTESKIDVPKEKELQGSILIAEDHPVNQMLLVAILEDKGNINFKVVDNGKLAVEALQESSFDLVLMDINMPVMDGTEALHTIKEMGIKTPVVAITANAIEGDKERYLNIGFDNYLSKPIEEKALDAILHKYLQNEQNSQNSFDIEKIAAELRIEPTIYLKLLSKLFAILENDLQLLTDAVTQKEYKEVSNQAHKIKGSAGNLRLKNIAKVAQNIENEASKNSVSYDYNKDIILLDNYLQEYREYNHSADK